MRIPHQHGPAQSSDKSLGPITEQPHIENMETRSHHFICQPMCGVDWEMEQGIFAKTWYDWLKLFNYFRRVFWVWIFYLKIRVIIFWKMEQIYFANIWWLIEVIFSGFFGSEFFIRKLGLLFVEFFLTFLDGLGFLLVMWDVVQIHDSLASTLSITPAIFGLNFV